MSDWAKRIADKKVNKTKRALERAESEQREEEKRRRQKAEESQKKAEKIEQKTSEAEKKKPLSSTAKQHNESYLWMQGVGSVIDLMDQLSFALKKEGVLKESLKFMRPPARPGALPKPIEFGSLSLPNGSSIHLTLKMERKLAHRREYLQPLIVLIQKDTQGKRTEDLLLAVMESGIVSPMMKGSFAASKLRRAHSLESVLQIYLEEKVL